MKVKARLSEAYTGSVNKLGPQTNPIAPLYSKWCKLMTSHIVFMLLN